MYPQEFFEFLKKWRETGKNPGIYNWPDSISLDKDAWSAVSDLHKLTSRDMHEYESSFFFADGEVVSTIPFKGEKSSVSANHKLNVKYVPKDNKYYQKQILLDGKVASQKTIEVSKLPKQINAGFLFNVHSHPVHYINKQTKEFVPVGSFKDESMWQRFKMLFTGYKDSRADNPDLTKTYSFFSPTDINSIIASDALLTGLVTDEFWLVCKTDKTIKTIGENGIQMLIRISESAYSGDKYLEDVIKQEMQSWGLVFYRAKFNQSLRKVI